MNILHNSTKTTTIIINYEPLPSALQKPREKKKLKYPSKNKIFEEKP